MTNMKKYFLFCKASPKVHLCFLAMLALPLLGCRWQSPPEVPSEATSTLPPPPHTPRTYQFPERERLRYGNLVREYYQGRPKPNPNKFALVKRHLELAEVLYEEVLAGSKVRLFQPGTHDDLTLLNLRLAADPPPRVDPTEPLPSFTCGALHYQVRPEPYGYHEHEAYVLFASPWLGGEVLGEGFLQEETALLETNFLPWTADLRSNSEPGASFARDLKLKQLKHQPVVLGLKRFLAFEHLEEIFGSRRLRDQEPFDPARYLKPLDNPMDLYFIAMAAQDLEAPGTEPAYTLNTVRAMTLLATRAFHDTLRVQHLDHKPLAIHTGNWGVEARGHSRRTIWAIQWVAMAAAYQLFAQEVEQAPSVAFHYDACDEVGLRAALQAQQVLAGVKPHQTLEEMIHLLFRRTKSDPAWQSSTLRRPPPSDTKAPGEDPSRQSGTPVAGAPSSLR